MIIKNSNEKVKVGDLKPTGILASRSKTKGRNRRLSLLKEEKKMLVYRANVEKAVAMFLDLNTERSWAQMAAELGIGVNALHNLTKTDEFNEVYNQYFSELGHDPRIKVSQQALTDMVPMAIRTLREILQDPDATTSARLKAIEMVFRMAGIEKVTPKESDKGELQSFLLGRGVNIQQVNISLPPELARAERLLSGKRNAVIEGEVVEPEAPNLVDALETSWPE